MDIGLVLHSPTHPCLFACSRPFTRFCFPFSSSRVHLGADFITGHPDTLTFVLHVNDGSNGFSSAQLGLGREEPASAGVGAFSSA